MTAQWTERVGGIRRALLERPWIARCYETYRRYYTIGMNHVAGSVTYFSVLTLFPFLTFVFAVLAYLAAGDAQVRDSTNEALAASLGLDVDVGARTFTAEAKETLQAIIGTLGVTGIVYAGRLWVDASRRALRTVWPVEQPKTNAVFRYVRDILVFLVFVAAMTVLIALALFTLGGPYKVFAYHGHAWPSWLVVLARAGAALGTVAWATAIFSGLYHRLGKAPRTRDVRIGALLAGLTMTVMVVGGMVMLRHLFADPSFGVVVAMIGLMLWVNLLVRMVLAIAVWTGTLR